MDETKPKNNKQKTGKKDEKPRSKIESEQKYMPGKNGGKLKVGNNINNIGRPPILPDIKKAIALVLGKEVEDDKTKLDALFERLYQLALNGDTRAAQILLDRGYGKALEKILIDPESNLKQEITVSFKPPEPLK